MILAQAIRSVGGLRNLSSLAEMASQENNSKLAISIWKRLLAEEPSDSEGLESIVRLLLEAGYIEESQYYLGRWMELCPENSLPFILMASALASLERWDEANSSISKALSVDPDQPEALSAAAKIAWNCNLTSHSFRYLRKAIELDPGDATYRNQLGLMLSLIGKQDQAVQAFTEALVLIPGENDIRLNLAYVLRQLGRHQEAYGHVLFMIDSGVQSPSARKLLGLLLNDLERFQEAVAILETVDVIESTELVQAYVGALRKLFLQDQASKFIESAMKVRPADPSLWLDSGRLKVDQGLFEEAEVMFDRALDLAPNDGSIHRAKANIRSYRKEDSHLEKMEATAKNLMPWTDDYIELQFAIGKAYDDIGDYHVAIKHFNLGNSAKRKATTYDEETHLKWFESVASFFSQPIRTDPPSPQNRSERPIFVVGMPRSGTTLVEQLLACHPEIVGLGEQFEFQRAFDRVVENVMEAGTWPLARQDYAEIGATYLKMTEPLTNGAVRAVDKMPSNVFFLGYIVLSLPNSKIIHVRRNAVDNCISIYSKLFGGIQSYSYDLSELGRFYRYYEDLSKRWDQVIPAENLLVVDYEAIVENHELETRRMLDFLKLPWDDACLSPHKREGSVLTASSFQVRKPIYKSSVGRRHGYLPHLEPLLEALSHNS